MNQEILRIIVKSITMILIGLICLFFFLTILRLSKQIGAVEEATTKGIDNAIKKRGLMAKYRIRLSKLGIAYRAGNYQLNPSWYILAKTAVGILLMLLLVAGLGFTPFVLFGFFGGYIFMDLYYKRANANDNKDMMMDLYNTYANLKIQLNSGIYIMDSLSYSHQVAQNERYREALGELIINMSDKTVSMDDAIEIFKNRFDSREIDKLCSLLHSYAQYGASESYAQDIMGEVQAIITASTLEAEHDIDNKAGMTNFCFFAVIIALVAYTVFSSFQGVQLFF